MNSGVAGDNHGHACPYREHRRKAGSRNPESK